MKKFIEKYLKDGVTQEKINQMLSEAREAGYSPEEVAGTLAELLMTADKLHAFCRNVLSFVQAEFKLSGLDAGEFMAAMSQVYGELLGLMANNEAALKVLFEGDGRWAGAFGEVRAAAWRTFKAR